MVYKMSRVNRIFFDSLVLTMLIFLIGFSLGFYFENFRMRNVIQSYQEYEVEALDLKLQNYYYQIMDKNSCEDAFEQNLIFADNLYLTGLKIEKYEEANQITEDILREKRKYVLLKTELWLNTILLKEKCGDFFDTIVYLYSNDEGIAVETQQNIISDILKSVKEEKGNSVILMPIAGDMDLGIVDLQMRIYGIDSLPSIIINEKTILKGFNTKEKIISHLEH